MNRGALTFINNFYYFLYNLITWEIECTKCSVTCKYFRYIVFFMQSLNNFLSYGTMKNFNLSSNLVYYFLKLIGLCAFSFNSNGEPHFSTWGLIYNTILALFYLYFCFIIYEARVRSGLYLPKETLTGVTIDFAGVSFQCITIFYYIIIFGLQKRFLNILRLCKEVDFNLKLIRVIGADEHCFLSKIFVLPIKLAIFNVAFVFIVVVDHLRFVINNFSTVKECSIWVLFHCTDIIRIDIILVFLEMMLNVTRCFQKINCGLWRYYKYNSKFEGNYILFVHNHYKAFKFIWLIFTKRQFF